MKKEERGGKKAVKTTSEILQDALLNGMSINKFQFMEMTPQHTVCLAQRIEELRKDGWVILDRTVKGKGNLKEYYLPPEEIEKRKSVKYQQLGIGLLGVHD